MSIKGVGNTLEEQRYTAAVGYAVKAHNGAVDEFFHNIGSIWQFRIERFQFGIVF